MEEEEMISATYSPDDNKLRLAATERLDADTYAKVKAAGFRWAPKQDLFVAPAWTPEREDLCLRLAGEIEDDDGSLVSRAEDRAERFEGYADARDRESDQAGTAADRLAGMMNGQPILVGHHSEKRHRRDIARMQDNARKSISCWETARYWERRAKAAIRHAAYKERADVRARRIKGLEADLRRVERTAADARATDAAWVKGPLTLEHAMMLANMDHGRFGRWSELRDGKLTPEAARRETLEACEKVLDRCRRWILHYQGRLTYERGMLAEQGGTLADQVRPEVGGGVACWAAVRDGYAYVQKVNKVSVSIWRNWGNGGRNFLATIPFDKLSGIVSRADVAAAREAGRLQELPDKTGFRLRGTGS
jgi:hypothetical protein